MSSRLCPWQSWAEWQWVYDCLYSGSADHRRSGIGRIATWRSRGPLPQAVEGTACLAEALLAESGLGVPGGRALSNGSVQLMLALAITRCVNGLADTAQKGQTARSISSCAAQLGLPSWLVDLRHDATHNALPSLSTLIIGAQHLLDYYGEKYWKPQRLAIEDTRHRMRGNLRVCRRTLAGADATPEEKRAVIEKVLSSLSETSAVTMFVDVLLEAPAGGSAEAEADADAGAAGAPNPPGEPDDPDQPDAAGAEVAARSLAPLLLTMQMLFPMFPVRLCGACVELVRHAAADAAAERQQAAALFTLVASQGFQRYLMRWESCIQDGEDSAAVMQVLAEGFDAHEGTLLATPASTADGDGALLDALRPYLAKLRESVRLLPPGRERDAMLGILGGGLSLEQMEALCEGSAPDSGGGGGGDGGGGGGGGSVWRTEEEVAPGPFGAHFP